MSHTLSKKNRMNLYAVLFLAPWLTGLLTITIIPLASSLMLSFTSYDMFTKPMWIGLQNYVRMFTADTRFLNSLRTTFIYVLVGVPLELAFALFLAILLNKGLKGLPLYRAIYYIPSLFGGSVAIAILWRRIFGLEGFVNRFLAVFGVEGISWISTPGTAVYTLVLLRVWQFGAPMIIFLAGLKQIPTELYEAAAIDGAGKRAQFFRITFPMLTPIVFFNMIMEMVNAFQAFTPAYIISDGTGRPLDSTLFYTLYLYQQGFSHFRMGYASALAWFLLCIIAGFTALSFLSSNRWVHYER